MAKFTKRRKRRVRKSPYSRKYIEARRTEMLELMNGDPVHDDLIRKAFEVSINP